MGNIPGSPVTDYQKEQVKEIVTRVTKAFLKYYLISFKEVMIEEGKERRKEAAMEVVNEAKRKKKEAKYRRPRADQEKKPRISSKIITWYELDSDVDPYIVYAINTTMDDTTVRVYKRYKQFKTMHSKFKVKGVDFPKPSSKFGARNLDREFIYKRMEVLGHYLDKCCEEEKISSHKDFQAWLGFDGKDKLWKEVFARAYERTRWYLWQWSWVVYDTEEEAIGRLVVEEVRRAMWSDIYSKLPPNRTVRKKVLQALFKALNATVAPAVGAAYGAAKKGADELKPIIEKTIGEGIDKILEVEEKIKHEIMKILQKALDPVIDGMKDMMKPLMSVVIPNLTGPVDQFFPEAKRNEFFNQVVTAMNTDDDSKLKELEDAVPNVRKEILAVMEEKLQQALEPVLGDLSGKVKIEALLSFFSPFKKINNVVKHFLEFVDPGNQIHVIRELLKHKKKIKEAPIADVEKMLDSEEWDIDYWAIWRSNSNIRWNGYRVAWQLYDSDFSEVYYSFYKFVDEIVEINKNACHKMSFRFGDFLSEAAKNGKATPENWHQTVDECFYQGFLRGFKCFKKQLLIICVSRVKELFRDLVIGKVEKLLLEGAETLLEPLTSSIPSPLDKVLDVMGLVTEVIQEAMDQVLDAIVGGLHPLFEQTLKQIGASPVTAALAAKKAEEQHNDVPVINENPPTAIEGGKEEVEVVAN